MLELENSIKNLNNSFINSVLASEDSTFTYMYNIIDSNRLKFAMYLLNISFRPELIELSKDFKNYIICGIGRELSFAHIIDSADIYDLDNVINKLNKLIDDSDNHIILLDTPGKIQAFQDGSTSASLYFTVSINKINILDVVIRYAGNFNNWPRITSFISKDFKKLL